MGHKVAKQCESCGNPTRRQQKYCSSVCYTEGRTCKVDIDCDYCGVTFETRQWKVNQGRRMCSTKCKNESQRITGKG
jgi:hypothetical protein